jgi:hypothetical protein
MPWSTLGDSAASAARETVELVRLANARATTALGQEGEDPFSKAQCRQILNFWRLLTSDNQ